MIRAAGRKKEKMCFGIRGNDWSVLGPVNLPFLALPVMANGRIGVRMGLGILVQNHWVLDHRFEVSASVSGIAHS
jgi:hypothetical protein